MKILLGLLIGFLNILPAMGNTTTATCSFSIYVDPSVALVSYAGNANDSFPKMNVTVNPQTIYSTGTTSIGWFLRSNSPGGATVNIYLPNLVVPSTGPNLANDLSLQIIDNAGAVTIIPAGLYNSGKKISQIPTAYGAAEALFSINKPGEGRAMFNLILNAPPQDGGGTLTGTLTMVATTQ